MSAAGLSATGPVLPRVPRAARPGGARPGASATRGWRGVALAISLLLHLAVGWWLLFGVERRAVEEPVAPSAMDVVFEGGAPEDAPGPPPEAVPAPLEPPGAEAALPEPPAPLPRMAEPAPPPPVAEVPPPVPVPAPPLPRPPVPPPVAQAPVPVPPPPAPPPVVPPLAQAPPLPLPTARAPSDMVLPPPPPAAEAPRETEMAALPLPPPPAPTPPAAPPEQAVARQAPPPRPQPRPRPAAPANPFAGALDLSQSGPVTLGRPAPAQPSSPGMRRERDSAAASSAGNADAPNAQLRIRGAQLGADWRAAFMAWLRQHGYYPRQAAEAGEDGTAVVRFSVDRSGRVSGLQLIGRSGSIWLDAGAQALLRGQTVPPFPPGTRDDSAEIDLTINYVLRRR